MSQIEVLVAMAVLTIGILAVCSVFAMGLRAEGQGGRITEATNYARQLIDLMRVNNKAFSGTNGGVPDSSSGVNDGASTRAALDAPPFGNGLMPAGTLYRRNIQVKTTGSGATGDYRNDLRQITVTVYWTDHGSERGITLLALARRP